MTNEHVLPVWLRNLLGTVSKEPFVRGRFELQQWRYWKVPRIDVKVKRVCESCNTGWMSDLEQRAHRVIAPMVLGQQRTVLLSSADQQLVSRWAFKTALMADLLHEKSELGAAVYQGFFKHRAPPDQCVIWTAAYGGGSAAFHLHRSIVALTSVEVGGKRDAFAPKDEELGVALTFNAFRVIFQVLLYEGDYRPSHGDVSFAHRIWPVEVRPLVWPRGGVALDHDSLERFAFRSAVL